MLYMWQKVVKFFYGIRLFPTFNIEKEEVLEPGKCFTFKIAKLKSKKLSSRFKGRLVNLSKILSKKFIFWEEKILSVD